MGRRCWKALLGVGLWLMPATALHAQAPGVDQVRFRVYGEAEGLPQSSVSALVQDSRGFVWLGTQDGLARFDGQEFRIYRRDAEDPASLADNYVQDMELSGDVLWVASPALGLSRIDLRSQQIRRFSGDRARAMGLPEDAYSGLYVSADDRLWLSLRSAGVRVHEDGSERFVKPPFEIPFQRRQRVLGESRSHGLLIASDDDLWRWSEARGAEPLHRAEPGQRAPVLAVIDGGIDRLWIATQGNGLLLIDGQGGLRRRLGREDGLIDDDVLRLLLDSRGRLWIGQVGGLCRLEADDISLRCWQHQPLAPGGLPSNRITSLLEDEHGRIWVGTWTGGVAIHAPEDERFLHISAASGPQALPSQAVTSITESADGSLWLTLIDGGGLVRFDLDQGVVQRWQPQQPELAAASTLVALHDRGRLWLGTGTAGLVELPDEGPARHYPMRGDAPQLGPPGRAIQSLYADREGRLWIGTLADGLGMLCAGCSEFRHYRSRADDPASLSTDSVNAILQTRDGHIWLALRRGGINRLDPDSGRIERHVLQGDEGAVQFSATALLEDSAGHLWVGTQGYGLQRVERDQNGAFVGFRGISSRQGLPADSIGAILEDAAGFLWVSTTAGLARVQPSQHRAEAWRPFSHGRGEDYFVGSALAAGDGRFLFGGVHGITGFRPEEVVLADAPPAVVIASAYVDHRPYAGAGETLAEPAFAESLLLRHPQTQISVDLATRPLLNAAPVRFAYRLEPIDADWSELPRNRRQASFSRLAPGDYRLQMRARFEGQSEWGAVATIPLQVQPPWWRTALAWWSYLLLVSLMLAVLLLLLRRSLEQRRAASRALAQSNALLKQSLWGSQGELWDCDLRSGRIRRENRLPHLKVDHAGASQNLKGLRPYVHPDDIGSFDIALRRCLQGEMEFLHVSYRTLDDQDQWRWMLTRGKLLERDVDGRPLRLVGTTFDITDVRAQEDALRESQARLRMALWGSGDELWDLDVVANRVHRENPLPQVELPSDLRFKSATQYLELAHEADRPVFRKALSEHIDGDSEIFEASFRLPAVGGGWVWVLARGRAVSRDEQGKALRIVGTNRDISQLKDVETELKRLNDGLEQRVGERTAELQATVNELQATLERLKTTQDQLVDAEKMAALGNLVAGVTHDINTPVGIAVTAATHLREQALQLQQSIEGNQLRRSELQEFLAHAGQATELIEDNLKRASNLVRSFKQVAVDQASEQIRHIDLAAYVDEILLSLRPGLKRRKVKVHNCCDPGIELRTYPGAIYQIVSNLVLNAVIHAFDDGRPGEVRIEARIENGQLWLQVVDDGRGMEEGIARHVFEPFFTTRRESGGSGLGLHIVYNLCTELLGGSVRCQTEPGQGTRIILQLPLEAPGAVAASGEGS